MHSFRNIRFFPLFIIFLICDCVAKFPSNSIFKFADDTTVVGRISNNDETEYRKEIENLVNWCNDNNLSLNVNKTKEIVVNFRKCKGERAPVHINGDEGEMVESFKFLGAQITNNLSWYLHADAILKKAHNASTFSGDKGNLACQLRLSPTSTDPPKKASCLVASQAPALSKTTRNYKGL